MRKNSKKEAQSPVSTSSSLKNLLEEHPVISLTSTVFTVVTVVAGVMNYINSSRIDLIGDQHKIEVANLIAKNERDLAERVRPLEKTIDDLRFRISSIERRLPGSGPAYVDVASMMIGPETVKALERQYTAFGGQDFFVAVPPMTDWHYSETNEYQHGMAISRAC